VGHDTIALHRNCEFEQTRKKSKLQAGVVHS